MNNRLLKAIFTDPEINVGAANRRRTRRRTPPPPPLFKSNSTRPGLPTAWGLAFTSAYGHALFGRGLMSAKRFVFACSLVSLALVACADKPRQILADELRHVRSKPSTTRPWPMSYEEIMSGGAQFGEVERQHPYSVWATQAQLMAAYAHYQRNKYDEAVAALDRFIKLNPGNPNAAYALYLKGLCYYEQITDVGRDQTVTHQAMATFESLIARYPENPYTRDARLKIDLTRNHLAGKEMAIGRFYADREQYLAAINRFRQVVDLTTPPIKYRRLCIADRDLFNPGARHRGTQDRHRPGP